jgi:hypothetical protein
MHAFEATGALRVAAGNRFDDPNRIRILYRE